MAVGSAASWIARRPRTSMAAAAATVGTAGFARGLNESPAIGDLQEDAFGDRRAVQAAVRGRIGANLSGNRYDNISSGDYYYGQHITGGSSGATTPVSGEIVFGQHNERR